MDRESATRVLLPHSLWTELEQLRAQPRRVADEPFHVHSLANRREWSQLVEPFGQQDRRAVEVAARPVVEADPDLEDPVVEVADGLVGRTPEELEGLVLLEELAGVQLLDRADQLGRSRVVAACADRLVRDRSALGATDSLSPARLGRGILRSGIKLWRGRSR